MNKNTSVLLSLILIFLASYFLYWKGEVSLEKASEKFTVLAFENTTSNCNPKSLQFFIENNSKEKNIYEISIISSDLTLENFTVSIPAQSQKLIHPKPGTLATLCAQSQKTKYQIVIKSKADSQSIYKLITP